MKFAPTRTPSEWISDCGRYRVWLRAQYTDGRTEYAAEEVGSEGGAKLPSEWIVKAAPSRLKAMEACEEHAARLINIL